MCTGSRRESWMGGVWVRGVDSLATRGRACTFWHGAAFAARGAWGAHGKHGAPHAAVQFSRRGMVRVARTPTIVFELK